MPSPVVEERHATWLELFFDLVIVVAVARLAELLHDAPGWHEVFLFVVLYYAMWSVWTSFTLYANVTGDLTRIRPMLLAMFGIAIMAASIPKVEHGEPKIFIIAYVWCRLMGAGSWRRTSRIMTEWPGVQLPTGIIPWVASLGFEPPVRYYLWVAGIVLDLVVSLVRSRHPEQLVADEQEELDNRARRRWRRRLRRRPLTDQPAPPAQVLQAAAPDRPHLGERLGLFVIIVLGEAVAQLVDAAADVPDWGHGLIVTLVAGFGLLVALWWLTLRYGAGAAPTRMLPLRLTMPAHYLMTGAIVLVAAGLGVLAAHNGEPVPAANRWVLCGGAALYFLIVSVLGARGDASIGWLLGWGLPAVAASVLLGVFGAHLNGAILAAILFAAALWHVLYRRRGTSTAPPPPAPEPPLTTTPPPPGPTPAAQ